MQTHQVCEQMVLLCDEEKMTVERDTANFKKIAFSPSPHCLPGFLLDLLLLAHLSLRLLPPLLE